jgi:hypothetical protein
MVRSYLARNPHKHWRFLLFGSFIAHSLGNCCSIHLSYSPGLQKSLSRIRWLGQVTETTSKDEADAQRIEKGAG